ncbi:transcription factor HHO3-like [Miscanthus floridulus]|uniref:transcription factor HHO3-like n=1 Tax=Miscanthus floridulus TaxID=154761 RepID=UPI00345828C0
MPGRAHLRNPDPLARSHPPPPTASAYFALLLFLLLGFRSPILLRRKIPRGGARPRPLFLVSFACCMGLDVGEIGMGLDLGLDLRLFAARSAGGMAAAAAKGAPAGIESCIRSLEEERKKIEVFRRELPLCARLLADVIDELKEEAAKRGGDAEAKADDGDKRKWMSTAQLWVDSDAKSDESDKELRSEITSPEPKLLGGAPMPIRAVAAVPPLPPPFFRREDSSAGTGLSLVSPATKAPISPVSASDNTSGRFCATMPPSGSGANLHSQAQQQASRKARRCWSPELHRQFVAVLLQLGGPQVATPKQIREVMQVDGLTNDEVKSHLQKYRLHNRRSPGAAPVSQPIMLVGGLWAPQEQSSSGSPQGPLQFSGSGVAISAATVGGGDSISSDEDDKSEGYTHRSIGL